jgi:UrcA family protein
MPHTFISATAALALAVLGCGGASAQESPQTTTTGDTPMVVRFADLNLSSDAGAQAAIHRIRTAAAAWCGGQDARQLSVVAAQKECVGRMTAKAVGILDAPRVTALTGSTPGLVLAGDPR